MSIVDPIQVTRAGVRKPLGYALICSGYLVENGKVLLVHHNGFDKWVPPGGNIEGGDRFDTTVSREFKEETGVDVEVLSATPSLHVDNNATALPGPFYVDLETEGFKIPAIVQFFYVRRKNKNQEIVYQASELHGVNWFTLDELAELETFDQVRSVATYALNNHPDA